MKKENLKIEGNKKYEYEILTIDSEECKSCYFQVLRKLKGKAKKVLKIFREWGEDVTFLDGKFHVSCDGNYWSWICHEVGTPVPKSEWATRFSGSLKEMQREFSQYKFDRNEEGKVIGFF